MAACCSTANQSRKGQRHDKEEQRRTTPTTPSNSSSSSNKHSRNNSQHQSERQLTSMGRPLRGAAACFPPLEAPSSGLIALAFALVRCLRPDIKLQPPTDHTPRNLAIQVWLPRSPVTALDHDDGLRKMLRNNPSGDGTPALRYGTWAEEGERARLVTPAVVDTFLLAAYFQTEAEHALVWQVEHNTSVLDHAISHHLLYTFILRPQN